MISLAFVEAASRQRRAIATTPRPCPQPSLFCRRARGSPFQALQDALQSAHIDDGLLQELADEYAACRGLEPLPAVAGDQQQQQQEQQGDQPEQQQLPSKRRRPSKAAGKGGEQGQGEAEEEALELPAELSEQQLRQVMRQLERQLAAGQADKVGWCTGSASETSAGGSHCLQLVVCLSARSATCLASLPPDLQALQQLEAADPGFLPDHPTAAFALQRCRFLERLAGAGASEALAVVRQRLSPLAQQHPELQPQLKAAMALLLPLAGAPEGGEAEAKRRQQGVADALSVRMHSCCGSPLLAVGRCTCFLGSLARLKAHQPFPPSACRVPPCPRAAGRAGLAAPALPHA